MTTSVMTKLPLSVFSGGTKPEFISSGYAANKGQLQPAQVVVTSAFCLEGEWPTTQAPVKYTFSARHTN